MSEQQIDFSSLNLPIPEIVYNYPIEKQQQIFHYLQQLNKYEKTAYLIAKSHLGTSFNIEKSNGYNEWKKIIIYN
jgi:hypothetical protein